MAEQLTDAMLGTGDADHIAPHVEPVAGRGAPETPRVATLDGPATEPIDLADSRIPTLLRGLALVAALAAVVALLVRRRR